MIALGSDQAGYELKQVIMRHLEERGLEYKDYGSYNADPVDYPVYGKKVAHAVADGECEKGILICGTGIGMAMAADKVPGVRAANIINPEFAALCREHNDANVITLSGRFVPLEENERILDAFFATPFGEGRHAGRVEKIMALEE